LIESRSILQGDVLDKLKEIEDESIDCIISSPPYWGLRDYGVAGQLGLEPDFRDYLKIMGDIMVQLKRVLKSTGSCWINLGDTYSGGNTHSDWSGIDEDFASRQMLEGKFKAQKKNHLQSKTRYGIPERFYINCIDNGWIARNHIPWYKSNSMPSSVKDRFTNKWESVFFFVKSQKYYFNLDAVREPTITESKPFNLRVRENITGHAQSKLGEKTWTATDEEKQRYNKDGTKKQDSTLGADGKPKATYKGFNERWKNRKHINIPGQQTQSMAKNGTHNYDMETGKSLNHPKGKNPGDVFFINPKPFTDAHFATFPPELPERIIKCACPENGMILDPFFGSGTVGMVSEKLNRRWMGIELNPKYIEIARRRIDPYMIEKLF